MNLMHLKITAGLHVAIYLCWSFIFWELNNPFQWIIDMPKYDYGVRASMLISYIFSHALIRFYISVPK